MALEIVSYMGDSGSDSGDSGSSGSGSHDRPETDDDFESPLHSASDSDSLQGSDDNLTEIEQADDLQTGIEEGVEGVEFEDDPRKRTSTRIAELNRHIQTCKGDDLWACVECFGAHHHTLAKIAPVLVPPHPAPHLRNILSTRDAGAYNVVKNKTPIAILLR